MIFGIIVLQQVESVIKSVLTTYHDHISSWGLCIILLTFTVRLVILPLTIKQLRSMAAMQTIQPKVKQLQNKYKGKTAREDKQEMQKELMELYKEHGVNPFASCLPLVAQLPVFIGLYQVLRNQIEPTPVVSFLGIDDIFQKLSSIGGITEYIILGLYVTTMLGSTLLFSFVTDRQQKYMFAAMPIFFIPFVIGVPAGVMIYWITTNIWTICQQGVVKRTMGHRLRPASGDAAAKGGAKGGGQAVAKATGSRTPPSPTGRRAQASGTSRPKKRRGGGALGRAPRARAALPSARPDGGRVRRPVRGTAWTARRRLRAGSRNRVAGGCSARRRRPGGRSRPRRAAPGRLAHRCAGAGPDGACRRGPRARRRREGRRVGRERGGDRDRR